MRVILHGLLAERYGRAHEIATNVPADALEGLSRQLSDWPRDLAVNVIDYDSEEKLRAQTSAKEIHVMPAMRGGGGVAKIVIGAVLVVAGVLLLPANPMIGWSLIMNGALMMLSGVAELLMRQPTVDNGGPSDPPASRYFGVNKNTVAIGTPIPMAYGRVKLAGHWLSLQSNSSNLVSTSFPVTTS